MKRLSAPTICCISCGAPSGSGRRSEGSRRDRSPSSRASGRSARCTPSQTSAALSSESSASAASARSTSSPASASRARRVWPTSTSTCAWAAGVVMRRATAATRTGSPL